MNFDISPKAITNRVYEDYGYTHFESGWIYGVWYCGTGFQKSEFYGQFPRTLVDRITTMFPTDKVRFLHLCCGGCNIPGALNVDKMEENKSPGGQANIRKADLFADAESLPLRENTYDVCFIDPPYTTEDAVTRYGLARLIRPSLVFNELYRILPVGGWVLWYDEKTPQISTKQWKLQGLIAVVKGRNRRWVGLSMFQKLDAGDWKKYQKEDVVAEFDTENPEFKEKTMDNEQTVAQETKRFKRTKAEIAAGLTPEQARDAREPKSIEVSESFVSSEPSKIERPTASERLNQKIEDLKIELSRLENLKQQLEVL